VKDLIHIRAMAEWVEAHIKRGGCPDCSCCTDEGCMTEFGRPCVSVLPELRDRAVQLCPCAGRDRG